MFSGAGIFADGLMIAIIVEGVIYLKADAQTIPHFDCEGLKPFSYRTKHGIRSIGSLRRMPERLYDDPDELAQWAVQALQSARRSRSKKHGRPARQKQPTRRA
jgi:DNA transformation protein